MAMVRGLRCAVLLGAAVVACSASTPPLSPTPTRAHVAPVRILPPPVPIASTASPVAKRAALVAAPSEATRAQSPQVRPLIEPVVDSDQTRAIILMYHTFNRGRADLTVDGGELDRQLTWLRENRVEIVATSELVAWMRGERTLPAKVAVLTIDDGEKSVYKVAWPILKRHHARFTLALPTKLMEEDKKNRMLTWDQVREMVASGLCELGSHGHEHKSIIHFSSKRAITQLETSRDIIERETGQRPDSYFYPLGAFDDRTAALVEQVGYRAAFKATGAPVGLDCCSLYAIPRVGIFHEDRAATLEFYFGASYMDRMTRRKRTRP